MYSLCVKYECEEVYVVNILPWCMPLPPDLEDYVRALLDPNSGIPLCDPAQGLFTGENEMPALTASTKLKLL